MSKKMKKAKKKDKYFAFHSPNTSTIHLLNVKSKVESPVISTEEENKWFSVEF